MVDVLNGIYEFLRVRYLSVQIYGGYIEVTKTKHVLQLIINECDCVVSVFKVNLLITCKRFDLTDPYSLQAIYEYISSRSWR